MSSKWPTLQGRLNHPLTSVGEALEQMERNGDVLSELGKRKLEKYRRSLKGDRQSIKDVSVETVQRYEK